MEEIITVDGRQFKLSTDRPLTAEEKAHTIAEIRKQTGCGTCGSKVAKMGNDWQYGGIKSLANTCLAPGAKRKSDDTVTLTAQAVQGTAPYKAKFYKNIGGTLPAGVVTGGTSTQIVGPGGAGGEDIAIDGASASITYTLTDTDVAGAVPSAVLVGAPSTIIFWSTITDSCPVAAGGPVTCTGMACEVEVGCITPTCNFTVT